MNFRALAGVAVKGYRAPSFSIGAGNRDWAFECLHRASYRYSSSVYPVKHDHYVMPDAPRFAYAAHDALIEIPPTTVRAFERNWPASGGGYFRLMPYALSRRLIQRANREDGQAAVFFSPLGNRSGAAAHPWHQRQDALPPLAGGPPLGWLRIL